MVLPVKNTQQQNTYTGILEKRSRIQESQLEQMQGQVWIRIYSLQDTGRFLLITSTQTAEIQNKKSLQNCLLQVAGKCVCTGIQLLICLVYHT